MGDFDPRGVNERLVRKVRDALDADGFERVKIVASGGFTVEKIRAVRGEGRAGRRLRRRLVADPRRERLHGATSCWPTAARRRRSAAASARTRGLSSSTSGLPSSLVVREGRSEDFGQATDLLNRVWPHRVGSERGLRHAAAAEPPDAHRCYWAAEDDCELVGWATASISYESSERPGSLEASVAP